MLEARAARRRRRRAHLQRSPERDAVRRRYCGQRHPRPRCRHHQLPLRARPNPGQRPLLPRGARRRSSGDRGDRRLAARRGRRHEPARRSACRAQALVESSRSKPGRTSPTSRREGSMRSTSVRVTPNARIAVTSSSRLRHSSTPTRHSGDSSAGSARMACDGGGRNASTSCGRAASSTPTPSRRRSRSSTAARHGSPRSATVSGSSTSGRRRRSSSTSACARWSRWTSAACTSSTRSQ